MFIDINMFKYIGNRLQKYCYRMNIERLGSVMVSQLTLNLPLGNTCRLTFVESLELTYVQFHEFCCSYHP